MDSTENHLPRNGESGVLVGPWAYQGLMHRFASDPTDLQPERTYQLLSQVSKGQR